MATKPEFETKLRDWYLENFPGDDLAKNIDPDATFAGLFETLDCHQDVYKYIGVGDSIIRELLFEGLASCMNVDHEYVYDQWLM